jgi:hypothetical protein
MDRIKVADGVDRLCAITCTETACCAPHSYPNALPAWPSGSPGTPSSPPLPLFSHGGICQTTMLRRCNLAELVISPVSKGFTNVCRNRFAIAHLRPDVTLADDNKIVPTAGLSEQTHELPPASSILKGDWVLFHPVYTPEELKAVEVSGAPTTISLSRPSLLMNISAGRVPRGQDLSRQTCCRFRQVPEVRRWFIVDRPHPRPPLISHMLTFDVSACRNGFDFVSRYKHKEIPPNSSMTLQQLREGGYAMDPTQWLAVSCNDPPRPRLALTISARLENHLP